jgi:hypothetical protein
MTTTHTSQEWIRKSVFHPGKQTLAITHTPLAIDLALPILYEMPNFLLRDRRHPCVSFSLTLGFKPSFKPFHYDVVGLSLLYLL